eukprot:1158817-Pelagomonas_calceolata.AAC.5
MGLRQCRGLQACLEMDGFQPVPGRDFNPPPPRMLLLGMHLRKETGGRGHPSMCESKWVGDRGSTAPLAAWLSLQGEATSTLCAPAQAVTVRAGAARFAAAAVAAAAAPAIARPAHVCVYVCEYVCVKG